MLLTDSNRKDAHSKARAWLRCRPVALGTSAGLLALLALPPVVAAQSRQVLVESLIYDLKNPDPVRRREAATLIGQKKVQDATPDLVAAVGDSDPSVRRAIVVSLQQVQDPRALPGFVALSADTEKDTRDRAIDGMTQAYLPRESGIGPTLSRVATFVNPWSDEWADVVIEPDLPVDPSVLQALEGRLADPEPALRAKAARSLGILRGRAAIPPLVVMLREDRSNAARFEAARALRKIGDPSVGAELLELVTYTDAKVRNEVVITLGSLRYQPAAPELGRLFVREAAVPPRQADRGYVQVLIGALALIADSGSAELFRREKASTDPMVALRAIEGLARIADPAMADEIVRDRAQQKDARIQAAQAWALHRMGRKEFMTPLVDALVATRTKDDVRQYLLESRPDDVPDLFKYTTHTDPNVRAALAEILGQVGDARAVPALRDLTRDRNVPVATAASQALQRINRRAVS